MMRANSTGIQNSDIMNVYWPQGYVHIYTGNGKGKTTAALGLAVRAAGHGLQSYIGQFMKGQPYGELKSLRAIPEITIEQFGKDSFVHIEQPVAEDIERAQAGLTKAHAAMLSGRFQLIILDEVLVAIHFKLLKVEQVLDFLNSRPKAIEVILTGRYAPDALIQQADLVTEMTEVKHYYHKRVAARDGIER